MSDAFVIVCSTKRKFRLSPSLVITRSRRETAHRILVSLAVALIVATNAQAQTQVAANPAGVWRGTSLCTVHPSACHDEIVVYRITREKTRDSLSIDARKIVNGQEEEMGVIECRGTEQGSKLTCLMGNGVWAFTIRGDSLVGELRLPNKTKYRDVRTARRLNVGSGVCRPGLGPGAKHDNRAVHRHLPRH